jgi:hypothetical protein
MYVTENYKVVDNEVKQPSNREKNLTWRPCGYHRRIIPYADDVLPVKKVNN